MKSPEMSVLQSFLPGIATEQVLILADWDNIFLCLYNMFRAEMRLEYRIKKMMEWIKSEIGEIFGGYGFMFAPEHLSVLHQQLCVENNFRLIICPKRQIRNELGEIVTEDTVDETIIWFGRIMLCHPDIKFICLVSGDDDYVPLMQEVGKYGTKRALVAPTIDSLSRSKKLIRLADKHPKTLQKMILRMDTV
jgi:hypothetical protein